MDTDKIFHWLRNLTSLVASELGVEENQIRVCLDIDMYGSGSVYVYTEKNNWDIEYSINAWGIGLLDREVGNLNYKLHKYDIDWIDDI